MRKMEYDLRPELKKYRWIRLPIQAVILKAANMFMPVIQKGRKLDSRLQAESIHGNGWNARLLRPKDSKTDSVLVYFHGGGFLLNAAAYHKNLAQEYALKADCAVLFVDYRLAPKYKFPVPVKDCFGAYSWALKNLHCEKVVVGGDSAGTDLAMAIMLLARKRGLRMPDGQLLIYPGCAGDPATESMHKYTDTPLWNAKLNQKALALYGNKKDTRNPLFSPILAGSFSGFPEAYIETAEYDCLHDAGVQIAGRYREDGVPVHLNETERTMHGYDIAESSPYVRKQVKKRIRFLRQIFQKE